MPTNFEKQFDKCVRDSTDDGMAVGSTADEVINETAAEACNNYLKKEADCKSIENPVRSELLEFNVDNFLENEELFCTLVKQFGGKILMKDCDYTGEIRIHFELPDGRQFRIGLTNVSKLEYLGVEND